MLRYLIQGTMSLALLYTGIRTLYDKFNGRVHWTIKRCTVSEYEKGRKRP